MIFPGTRITRTVFFRFCISSFVLILICCNSNLLFGGSEFFSTNSFHLNLAQNNSEENENQINSVDSILIFYAGFPLYEQVIAHLASSLSSDQLPDPMYWVLEKKPAGWCLQKRIQNDLTVTSTYWIWKKSEASYTRQLFLPPPHGQKKYTHSAWYLEWSDPKLAAQYDWSLFAGYSQADRHTINCLSFSSEWPPFYLNALAQAYLGEAERMLGLSKWSDPRLLDDTAFAAVFWSPDSLKQAKQLLEMGLTALNQLKASAPDWSETGRSPELMLHLAYARAAWFMQLVGMADASKTFFRSLQFPSYFEAYGRNLLTAMPEGAVSLVTNSLDFFLMASLQSKEGLRSDVQLVPMEWCAAPGYYYSLLQSRMDGESKAPVFAAEGDSAKVNIQKMAGAIAKQKGGLSNLEESVALAIGFLENKTYPVTLVTVQSQLFSEGKGTAWTSAGLYWQLGPLDSIAQAQIISKLYTDQFRYPAVSPHLNFEKDALNRVARYRNSSVSAAFVLARNHQKEDGLRLLNIMYRNLPEWVIPLTPEDLGAIRFYYAYGSPDRGGEMGLSLFRHLTTSGIISTPGPLLDELEKLALLHQQMDLTATYQKLRKDAGL